MRGKWRVWSQHALLGFGYHQKKSDIANNITAKMKFTFVTSLLATAIIAFPLEARQNISTGTGSGKFPAVGFPFLNYAQLRKPLVDSVGGSAKQTIGQVGTLFFHIRLTQVVTLKHYTTDHTLTKHTIYMPIKPSPDVKLPVVVWGNGACLANGLRFQDFLTEVASHGYIAIASGAPNGTGETTSKWMTHSIDWVVKHAGKGKYATVDAKRIVAAGQSCGGLEAYDQKNDPRIRGLGIFNSGLRNNTNAVANITKPVFYFMGGPTDIAYANVSFFWLALLRAACCVLPSPRSYPNLFCPLSCHLT